MGRLAAHADPELHVSAAADEDGVQRERAVEAAGRERMPFDGSREDFSDRGRVDFAQAHRAPPHGGPEAAPRKEPHRDTGGADREKTLGTKEHDRMGETDD